MLYCATMSTRITRRAAALLALLALLFGQVGAQLHDFSHLKHDVAVVLDGPDRAPPIHHSAEVCVAYSYVCSAVNHVGIWHLPTAGAAVALPVLFVFFLPLAVRLQFDTRAPPSIRTP